MLEKEHRDQIREVLFPLSSFVRAIFSGSQQGKDVPWVKVVIRPVELKGEVFLQFSYFDRFKDITKNFNEDEALSKLDELLDIPFKNIRIETLAEILNFQFSKKNRLVFHRERSSAVSAVPDLAHDKEKQKILSADSAIPFLKAVGIAAKDGKIKAEMQRKYTQINEFLRIFAEIDILQEFKGKQVHVVDFGCGNAYLTFATYYYLTSILDIDAHVVGVDIKDDLLEKHRQKARDLGWDQLSFVEGRISNYQSEVQPDIVIALHACDTATDDALAFGVKAGSRMIVTAPCCQHYLQAELAKVPMPPPMLAVGHDGILEERLGDILTDTFRATLLRIFGYHTDVIQFVPIEHTAKNLMIRAFKPKDAAPPSPAVFEEYQSLKKFWGVAPYLERLLSDELVNIHP